MVDIASDVAVQFLQSDAAVVVASLFGQVRVAGQSLPQVMAEDRSPQFRRRPPAFAGADRVQNVQIGDTGVFDDA